MAAETKYWQPDFDPAATYIVAAWPAGFTVRGREPKRGEIFDNNSVPPNMLRSHYEARWITMAASGGSFHSGVRPDTTIAEALTPPPRPHAPAKPKRQANSRTLT